jgi:YQGE family putative transporter
MGVMGNFILLITPPVSGFLISEVPGISGYIWIFLVSVIAFVCSAFVSRRMPSEASGRAINTLWLFIRDNIYKKPIYRLMLGGLVFGIRDGVFMYFLNILIYSFTVNEFVIGLNITARGILSMVAFYLGGKIRTNRMRSAVLLVTCALLPVLVSGIYVWYTVACLIIVNILDAGLSSIFYSSYNYITYEVSEYSSMDGHNRMTETISMRIASLNFGRVIGLIIFLSFTVQTEYIILMLLALNVLSMFSGVILNAASKASRDERV